MSKRKRDADADGKIRFLTCRVDLATWERIEEATWERTGSRLSRARSGVVREALRLGLDIMESEGVTRG